MTYERRRVWYASAVVCVKRPGCRHVQQVWLNVHRPGGGLGGIIWVRRLKN